MKYFLMHKNIEVCEIEISENTFTIDKVDEIFNKKHVPLGLIKTDNTIDIRKLNHWYKGRAIPASRSGLKEALELMDIDSSAELILKCYGLSLSDQYWFRPYDSTIKWEDINFFDNPFSEDVGNALFGRGSSDGSLNLLSPDNTSDGWLKKRWAIIDGERCLIKAGSAPFYQEPLNEKAASVLQKRLAYMPFTEYDLIYDDDKPLSVCRNFVNSQTELISAYSVFNSVQYNKNESYYAHFVKTCNTLGIPGYDKFLNYMLVVDYIIANSDRHLRNFGVIRNADTLEWIGFAPLFDCGTSLWYDKIAKNIKPVKFDESKPFASTHQKQIRLVTDTSWINFDALIGIDDEFYRILQKSEYIDERRRDSLCYALNYRISMLKEITQQAQ